MRVECVEESAVLLTNAVLGSDGVDRRTTMPVAALVIADNHGKVALRGHGPIIPTTGELPSLTSKDATAQQIVQFLASSTAPLEAASYEVEDVSHLTGKFERRPTPLQAGLAFDGRKVAMLPLLLRVSGQDPDARPYGFIWEYRQNAFDRLRRARGVWPYVGTTLLNRAFAGRRVPWSF